MIGEVKKDRFNKKIRLVSTLEGILKWIKASGVQLAEKRVNCRCFITMGGGEAKDSLHHTNNQSAENTWRMSRVRWQVEI
jgi:hypothetical protein